MEKGHKEGTKRKVRTGRQRWKLRSRIKEVIGIDKMPLSDTLQKEGGVSICSVVTAGS